MTSYYKDDYYTDVKEVYILVEDDSGLRIEHKKPIKVCTTLAHIDPYTGKLSDKLFNVAWYPKNEDEKYKRFFYDETIYKIKVAMNEADKHGASLLEILEVNAKNQLLEDFLAELKKPVIIQDDILGEITLDKHDETFTGSVDWLGTKLLLTLEVEVDYKASWTRARKAAAQIVENQKDFDSLWKNACVEYVLPYIKKWCEENKELKAENYTKEKLLASLELADLVVYPSGTYLASYADSDLFQEHAIEVHGSLKKGIKSVEI
ncbi:DUF2262 domain-containing protein [Gallibacterium salpingitidis]|uniref:Uncharacterized protein n=1 Tax=Gallibacterium salpingitidis TaxID=505341 RepID=A0A1A7NW42_9PAST|nr:DUF2262 domain-containing protein [Gallibacterium salpingitidis]OBW94427.1 hypothetical protein QS62_06090 [Gallibacterium salpingitidis]